MKKLLLSMIFILVILSSMFTLNAFAAEMTDGIYEVSIALWHSEDDKESMAADSVGTKATIEVANGVKTMHITSGEMSMMGIKASLQELRIADKNGNFTDAKVESRNSEGNPTGFYFTLPHTDEYITVKVNPHIAIMGNKDIGARIKVDYSSLKLIESSEAVTEETTVAPASDGSSEVSAETTDSANVPAETTAEIEIAASDEATDRNEPAESSNAAVYIIIAAVIFIALAFILIKRKRSS